MTVFNIPGLVGTEHKPAAPKPNDQMGRDEFLNLLVEQLKHQDPLSPMNAEEFASQLAQFSSVEQLSKLNDAFAAQQQQQAASTFVNQTALGASLIGKTVVAQGDQLSVGSDGKVTLRLDVSGSGGNAVLALLDGAGNTIGTKPLGALSGGTQTLDVDGLPPGDYHYQVKVTGADGANVPTQTFTTGIVQQVLFDSGTVYLQLDKGRVALDSLAEITN
jgi:flagellar basal-body rod modification protein FlgD